jgi:hypothetical protein
MSAKHTGPAPSEYLLFVIWDAIEAERLRGGEKAAAELAERALRAIQPEEGTKP